MSKRYTYARTLHTVEGPEVFTAVEFDSFDEAINAVNKGIHERKLALKAKYPDAGLMGQRTGAEKPSDALTPGSPFPPKNS